MAGAAADEDGPEDEIFSEEDRRLLELVRRELGGTDPLNNDASDRPPKDEVWLPRWRIATRLARP